MIVAVGTDIVEIQRVTQAAQRRERFLQRLFTEDELAYCRRKANPWPSLAARFAAKEAVWKILKGSGPSLAWRQIEVVTEAGGKPRVRLHGRAAQAAQALMIDSLHLSLSHCREYAVAMAVAERAG